MPANMHCVRNPSGTFSNATVKGRLLVPGTIQATTSNVCHLNVLEDAVIECLNVANKTIEAVIGPVGTVIEEGQVLFQTLQAAIDNAQQWDLGDIRLELSLPTGVVRQTFTENLDVSNEASRAILQIRGPAGDQFAFGHVQGHAQAATNAPAALGGGGVATITTGVNTITVSYLAGINPTYNTLATPVLNGDQLLAYSALTGLVSAHTITSASGNVINLLAAAPNLSAQGSAIVFSPRITTNSIQINTPAASVRLHDLEFDYDASVSGGVRIRSAESLRGRSIVVRQLIPATTSNAGVLADNESIGLTTWNACAIWSSQGLENSGTRANITNCLFVALPGGPASSHAVLSDGRGDTQLTNSFVGGATPAQGIQLSPDRYRSIDSALVIAQKNGKLELRQVDLLQDVNGVATSAALVAAGAGKLHGDTISVTSTVAPGTFVGPLTHSWQNSSLVLVDPVSTLAGPAAGLDASHFQASFCSMFSISGQASDTQNGDVGIRIPFNSQVSAQSGPLDANSALGTPPTVAVSLGDNGATNTQATYDLSDNTNTADAVIRTSSYYRIT